MEKPAPDFDQSNVAVLVVSCDAYQDLWAPFFACFNKYWDDCPYNVYLGANYSIYKNNKVSQILIGDDIDYSTNLINILNKLYEEWVIVWVEDRVLNSQVDTPHLTELIKKAIGENYVYLKLISSHPYAVIKSESEEFGRLPKFIKYRVCLTVGLWKKEVLLKLLKPGESAWQFERRASTRAISLPDSFFALSYKFKDSPPISVEHLIIKGAVRRDALDYLRNENLLKGLDHRKVQSRQSYLYMRAYIFLHEIITILKYVFVHVF